MRALAAIGIFLGLAVVFILVSTGERFEGTPPCPDNASFAKIEAACRELGIARPSWPCASRRSGWTATKG